MDETTRAHAALQYWSRVLGHAVKDNQEGLREDIDVLFQPHRQLAGTSAPPNDFRTARTVEKGHGRLDRRTITGSHELSAYSTWPELAQVFKLESQRNRGALWRDKLACSCRRAPPLTGIDPWPLGHVPHVLAILNTVVLGLLIGRGRTNLAEARREFAYQFDRSLAALAA